MNKPIRTVSIFCMFLFLALMINATYLQFFAADGLNKDPRNRRVLRAAYSAERGSIIVGRKAIASSVESDDEYEYQRTYGQPFTYAPVTGYFTFGNATGIERSQNSVLTGDDPRLFVRRVVDLVSNSRQRGGSVKLTLDPAAQAAAYKGLSALGPNVRGAVVAIEPATGKILAMVSLPTFNPNNLASHDFNAVQDLSTKLNTDPAMPLLNRAIQTRLAPGSVFKIVTAAAAIESGKYDSADALVPGGSTYELPQSTAVVQNEGRDCGSDRIPFRQAMENSCNTSFAALAAEVGAKGMLEQAEKFGFNDDGYLQDLGPLAASVYPESPDEPLTALTGFGQFEVQSTPLQMAMVAAGIANQGTVMRPYVVDEIRSADFDGRTIDPEEYSQAITPETSDVLTELMVSTVEDGTASPAAIPNVDVAGKTGTAQSGVSEKSPYAWFVSFAPAKDAKVAVAVMIENADIPRSEIAGGQLGGPIAKAVMEAVLEQQPGGTP